MKTTLRQKVMDRFQRERAVRSLVTRLQTGELKRFARHLEGDTRAEIETNAGPTGSQRSETRWRGASQVLRSLAGWFVPVGSGRTDQPKAERDRLTARSFDAYRNHMLGGAVVTRARTNIVGTGLVMHPTVDAEALGISEDEADALNSLISREFSLYINNPSECDYEGTLDGAGQQALALVTALLAGDCIALTPFEERPGNIYGLKVQLIDPARVSNPAGLVDSPTLLDGVEMAPSGMPIAVHIQNRHPADRSTGFLPDRWDRRPIYAEGGERRVFQIWNDKDRIGATRGIPWLAPILEPLQQLEQYSRAELMAAVISSMFTVFIKKEVEKFDDRGMPIAPLPAAPAPDGEKNNYALGVGAVWDMDPGEEAQFANPSRPNANYDPFFMSIATQIGARLEIPVDEVMLKYQSSYSAARAAMLQAYRFYTMRRWWLVQQFCQPHFKLWFDEAVARGRIPVTGYTDPIRRAAYHQNMWVGPARGSMDEGQEATAMQTRINAGVSNETIETAQSTGEPWSAVFKQRVRELRIREAAGVPVVPASGSVLPPQQSNVDPANPKGPPNDRARPPVPPNKPAPSQPERPS